MLHASRRKPPSDQLMLDIKIGIFLAGAVFGIAGMFRDSRTLILIGIAILVVGMILRAVEARRRRRAEDAAASAAEHDSDDTPPS